MSLQSLVLGQGRAGPGNARAEPREGSSSLGLDAPLRFRLKRVAVGPFARVGAAAGALAAIPFAALLGLVLVAAVRTLHETLNTWERARVPLPLAGSIQVDFVGVLGLAPALDTLRRLDGVPLLVCLAVATAVILLMATLGAIAGAAAALLFNLAARYGGGLVLEGTAEGPTHSSAQSLAQQRAAAHGSH